MPVATQGRMRPTVPLLAVALAACASETEPPRVDEPFVDAATVDAPMPADAGTPVVVDAGPEPASAVDAGPIGEEIDWASELAFEDVDAPQQPGYSRGGTPLLPRDFNRGGQRHNDQCVRASRDMVPLRYADFTPTGYVLHLDQLVRAHPLTDDDDGHACADGELQLDAQEILTTPMGRLLFFRGGYGYLRPGNIKYGHVWIGDTMDHTDVRNTANGNGAACLASTNEITEGHFAIRPAALPPELRYPKSNYDTCVRTRSVRECSISYRSYGDPGFEQGDPAVLGERFHYTYLVWSWPNVSGGGVVRALLGPGDVFHRCNVRSLRVDSIDLEGDVNGWVQAVYGKTYQGGNWLYGWTVYAHQLETDPEPVLHVERLD